MFKQGISFPIMSKILTFQRILPACEEGREEGWRAYLSRYTPIVFELLGLYTPWTAERRSAFWRDALRELGAEDFKRLREFPHQAEREFLVDLRAFLLDRVLPALEATGDFTAAPSPTAERVAALLEGAPLLHQEIMFLKLAGYSDATIEQLLRALPRVGQAGLERLKPDYAVALAGEEDRCLWPAGWLALTAAARAARKQDCPPLRQLIRVLDGQITWYEKEPVEQHRAQCLSCLEHWTSLLEVVGWAKRARPLPAPQLDAFLAAIPLKDTGKRKKPFFKRLFA